MKQRLLLLSNSTVSGSGFLDHAEDEIRDLLGRTVKVLFVPFALHDQKSYGQRVSERFGRMNYEVECLSRVGSLRQTVNEAKAIFIGGGNTFRLLRSLYDHDLLEAIRERVRAGVPYLGSSAGSNVAGPTIRTTNDMPIVEPPSLTALGLVPWQINPHYLDPDPASTHMGETREERLLQYLEENTTPVIALREGAWLRAEGSDYRLGGTRGARLFRRASAPEELHSGARLGWP